MVKVCFAIAVFISYNLQFLVGVEIIWNYIFNASKYLQSLSIQNNLLNADGEENLNEIEIKKSASRILFFIESIFRSCVVIFTFLLAICIPKIDLFIALVGAVASSTLAIVIPPLLDLMIFWPMENYSKKILIKNVIVILFGFYIFVAGTYCSISDIVNYFKTL
jgi:proton-coupled amino acid transporter